MAIGTPTVLQSNWISATQTNYTVPSSAPASGSLLTLFVESGRTDAATEVPSSVTGMGLTWNLVASQQTPLGRMYGALYKAVSDGTSGALTVTYANAMQQMHYRLVEWPGAADVIQSGVFTGVSTCAVTLASAITAGSATAGFFGVNSSSQNPTNGSGYSDLGTFVAGSTPAASTDAEYRLDGQQLVDFTPAGTSQNLLIAVEISEATGPTLDPPTSITATAISSDTIRLAWTPDDIAVGVDIERDSVVIATNVSGTTYDDTGRSPSTSYDYRLRSVG